MEACDASGALDEDTGELVLPLVLDADPPGAGCASLGLDGVEGWASVGVDVGVDVGVAVSVAASEAVCIRSGETGVELDADTFAVDGAAGFLDVRALGSDAGLLVVVDEDDVPAVLDGDAAGGLVSVAEAGFVLMLIEAWFAAAIAGVPVPPVASGGTSGVRAAGLVPAALDVFAFVLDPGSDAGLLSAVAEALLAAAIGVGAGLSPAVLAVPKGLARTASPEADDSAPFRVLGTSALAAVVVGTAWASAYAGTNKSAMEAAIAVGVDLFFRTDMAVDSLSRLS